MTDGRNVTTGRASTEGDGLFFEVRGNGAPLLMIAPAGGDGWLYSAIATRLADEFKVIAYDRRGNARSSANPPQNFELGQQSRDAVAVLQAAGESSAFIFGNSSGAVIALDLLRTHPQAVRTLVAHEPPLAQLHPSPRKWQRFFAKVYLTAFRFGSSVALLRFFLGIQLPLRRMLKAAEPVNRHRRESREPYIDERRTGEFLIKQEMLPIINYIPDFETIRSGRVPVYVGAGEWGLQRNAWYSKVARNLAARLNAELVTFPGHHAAFLDEADAFAATLRDLFRRAPAAQG